jgi:hypothetical protein
VSEVLGGDKPRRYFLGRDSSVGAGFIPARKGLNIDSFAQLNNQYLSTHQSLFRVFFD